MANNKNFKVKNGIKPTAYHEAVGTITSGSTAYYLQNASYDGVSENLNSENNSPMGLYFTDDGTQMFMVGASADEVNQYTLSTAWDINTLTYVRVLALAETIPSGIFFKDDGTKMYIAGYGGDNVYEHTLSTAWDISTGTITHTLDVSTVDNIPFGLFFKPDGTKMYFSGDENDKLVEYNLGTAWDLSTATFNQYSPSIVPQPRQPFFTSDGLRVFIPNNFTDVVTEYSLSTAWDASTLSYVREFDVSDNEPNPYVAVFKSDGTKMYVIGSGPDTIFQYSTVIYTKTLDLSTGSIFELSPTQEVQINLSNPASSGSVSQATLLLEGSVENGVVNSSYDSKFDDFSAQTNSGRGIAWKTDGTSYYLASEGVAANRRVYQYNLTTAWDISTASYANKLGDISSQATAAKGVAFKPDGTKMYVCCDDTNSVWQYSLSTAWDVSTISYDSKSKNINGEEANITDVKFKPDGTVMFIIGKNGDEINQYTLSTAWDVSTATYSKVKSVSTETLQPEGMDINSDGTLIIVAGDDSPSKVHAYRLGVAYDIATMNFIESFDVSGQVNNGDFRGVAFGNNDTKFYATDNQGDDIHQYSALGNDRVISYASNVEFSSGSVASPSDGDTDIITFTTTDGGTSYQANLAIDGAR